MYRRIHIYCIVIIILLTCAYNLQAQTIPLPLKDVKIQARVVLDEDGIYHYYHTVTNPVQNKIGISDIRVDITVPNHGSSPGDVWAEGYAEPDSFTSAAVERKGLLYIPIAWKNTALWGGDVGREDGRWSLLGSAVVFFWGAEHNLETNYRYLLNPGETSEELEMISYGLPGIRKAVFKPTWWILNLPADYFLDEEKDNKAFITNNRKKESLGCLSTTIGPTGVPAYTRLQFNQMLQEYVTQSVNLGWLKDAALTQQLNNYLTQSAAAISENRLLDAQNIINQFMNAVQTSSLSQRTNEAYALLYYNAKFFFQQITAELPVIVEIFPSKGEHFLNEEHTTQAKAMQGYVPVGNRSLTVRVISGPNEGLLWRGKTDGNGNWSFAYKSEKIGTDILQFVSEVSEIVSSDTILWQPSQSIRSAPITVTWKGGPDLMLNELFPPIIKIPFSKPTIPLKESTINIGNSTAPVSVTRCYLTKNKQMSPDDTALCQRAVPSLDVNAVSEYQAAIPVPGNLDEGIYYIYCCADANKEIIELSETNNCQTLVVQVYVPVESSGNRPPDCTEAKASPNSLWPPNHKYQKISISGVTDPEGDNVTTAVNYVKQDEPVNGLGDGDTSPDATLNPLQVRAERSGTGNGRVYQIGFTAEDGKGGKCEGTVKVCVPHDQGQGKVCIDDGPQYDSTKP